jgi:hypothetical protein
MDDQNDERPNDVNDYDYDYEHDYETSLKT